MDLRLCGARNKLITAVADDLRLIILRMDTFLQVFLLSSGDGFRPSSIHNSATIPYPFGKSKHFRLKIFPAVFSRAGVSDPVPVFFFFLVNRRKSEGFDHPVRDLLRRKAGIVDLQMVFKPVFVGIGVQLLFLCVMQEV